MALTPSKPKPKSDIPPRPPKITDAAFKRAEILSLSYIARPEFGLTLKDVVQETYWANVASMLRPGYTIRCMPEGLTWFAELLVVDASMTHAKVKVLHFVDLSDAEQILPEQSPIVAGVDLGKFKVQRSGTQFRVIRSADNEVMKGGFLSAVAAKEWAAANLQTDSAKLITAA